MASAVPPLKAVLIELAEEHEARAEMIERQAQEEADRRDALRLRERARECREAARNIRF